MANHIGGQAVIEGVMMRNESKVATAVRLPNGKIIVKKDRVKKRSKFWKTPFLRGIIALWDMLFLGMKTLLWSADQQLEKHEKITKKEVAFTVILSLGFSILVFFALPYLLTGIIGFKELTNPILFNVIDGIIKIAMFVAYIYAISFMSDVKTLFQYHGAEHKAVYCHEANKKLSYDNVKKYSTEHPRCGTSFIVIVFGVSIIVFSIVPTIMLNLVPSIGSMSVWLQKLILLPIRLLFLPLVAGIAFELLKLSGRLKGKLFFKIFIKPGLLLQGITTKEPNKKQVEVAIKALKAVL